MNRSTVKKQARELQAITGMPYQSAHRAVLEGTEFEASVRSGGTLGDFVTPHEQRVWHRVNRTGALDCERGRHWTANQDVGQCVGCGAYLAAFFNADGDDYEAVIGEEEFFARCVQMEAYSLWAPPLARLGGHTQRDYFSHYWRPSRESTGPWPTYADPNPWATAGDPLPEA